MTTSNVFRFPLTEAQPHRVETFELRDVARAYRCFLVFDEEAEPYAYRNLCPHWAVPLSEDGDLLTRDAQRLHCMKHGAEFELRTGLCTAGPCEGDRLRALIVKVDREQIEVSLPPKIVV